MDGWGGLVGEWEGKESIHWPSPGYDGLGSAFVYTTFRMNAIQQAINTLARGGVVAYCWYASKSLMHFCTSTLARPLCHINPACIKAQKF